MFKLCLNVQIKNAIHNMNTIRNTNRVRYGETDQMGVVYHGNYAIILKLDVLSGYGNLVLHISQWKRMV